MSSDRFSWSKSFCAGWYGTLAILWLIYCKSTIASASVVTNLEIENPESYWNNSYIQLVPAIHPPTTHDHGDLIQVWLKLPRNGLIDVEWLADQSRYTLRYPSGTVADRVEYFYLGDDTPHLSRYSPFAESSGENSLWSVADVRGTRVSGTKQYFHVYRPTGGQPHAALRGWSWPRDNDVSRRKATDQLIKFASKTVEPLSEQPMTEAGLESLRNLNNCASCHRINQPAIDSLREQRSVERATDTLGFIVPNAVLHDDCVVATHRPDDINTEDPFVTVRCDNGKSAVLKTRDGNEYFTCSDDSQPRGYRDVSAGLAENHPYTQALCQSRRALYEHMTIQARGAFAEAFSSCGIGSVEK